MHDKPLHLIVVRRDLSGFQHLHPTMAPDGTWGIDLTLAEPGIYRMIADFTAIVGGQPGRRPRSAATSRSPGNYAPVALPAPARQATTDGFTVDVRGRRRGIGATQPMLMTVTGPAAGRRRWSPTWARSGTWW